MATKTANLDILNSLIEAGLNKETAERLASELLTRTEASESLSTKQDLVELKAELQTAMRDMYARTIQWVAAMLVAQAAAIVALQNLIG